MPPFLGGLAAVLTELLTLQFLATKWVFAVSIAVWVLVWFLVDERWYGGQRRRAKNRRYWTRYGMHTLVMWNPDVETFVFVDRNGYYFRPRPGERERVIKTRWNERAIGPIWLTEFSFDVPSHEVLLNGRIPIKVSVRVNCRVSDALLFVRECAGGSLGDSLFNNAAARAVAISKLKPCVEDAVRRLAQEAALLGGIDDDRQVLVDAVRHRGTEFGVWVPAVFVPYVQLPPTYQELLTRIEALGDEAAKQSELLKAGLAGFRLFCRSLPGTGLYVPAVSENA